MKAACLSAALVLSAVALAGCTVHQTEAPGLSGPSGLALTIRVSASPDSISQDGGSQSSIQVTAIGPDGKGKAALPLRMDMFVGGVGQDFGTLSARTLVTDSSGVAKVVYTAPPSPTAGIFGTCKGLPGNCVDIVATASGADFQSATPEFVTIRLVPPGVILPPAGAPTAAFTFSPTSATANAQLLFDASSSQVGSGASQIVSYAWTFGDGSSGTGKNPTHTYTVPGSFNVTLTVTNDRTLTNSTSQTISVGAGAGPSAAFEFSPKPVVVKADIFFDATASRAAAGHTIAQYQWNWGDGSGLETHTNALADHDFAVIGTYTVVLTVTDEAGQQATTKQDIAVGSGAPVPVFTTAVTNAATHTISANGSASTATGTATIVSYAYDWGDGTTVVASSDPVQTHTYSPALTYPFSAPVRLTVTDSLGRVGTSLQPTTVIVP